MGRLARGSHIVGTGNSLTKRIRMGLCKRLNFSRLGTGSRDARRCHCDADWISVGSAVPMSQEELNTKPKIALGQALRSHWPYLLGITTFHLLVVFVPSVA